MRRGARERLWIGLLVSVSLAAGCADDPADGDDGGNNGELDLNGNNDSDQGVNNGESDQSNNGEPDQGDNNGDPDADPDLPEDTGGACSPNPCLQPPAPSCQEDGVTLVSAAAQGDCTENNGMARCAYAESTTNCAAQGRVCEDGACVIPQRPQPAAGQMIITEIMYNPLGIEDENAEFIEIYNTTDQDFALDGCALEDDSQNSADLAGVVAAAGGAVLLGRNLDRGLNGGLTLDGVFAFGLGNSGDTITLRCGESVIDAVTYDDGGAFPEATAASLNLNPAAYDAAGNDLGANWCLSEAVYYTDPMVEGVTNAGSPGSANAACPERDVCDPNPCTQAPAATCLDEATLVTYGGEGACEAVEGAARCQYEETRTDCAADGRLCRAGACLLDLPSPGAGEVVVTEIMYDPQGELSEERAEWVELYNNTQEALRLDGCLFRDNDPTHRAPLDGLVMAPQSYLVLGRTLDMAMNGGIAAAATFGFGLNNGGDSAVVACGEQIIDEVAYSAAGGFPGAAAATAINLDPQAYGLDNAVGASWCLATTTYYSGATPHLGTPGAANVSCEVVVDVCDPNPCALPADDCLDETILVFYSGDLECVDVDGAPLCDEPFEDLFDCADFDQICMDGACVDAPSPGLAPGEVIFNEIMFDTNMELNENNAEWFELYNTTDRALSLEGCVFRDNIATTAPVGAVSVPAGGYVVFARSADRALNGGIAVAGTMNLALGNNGDILRLECGEDEIDAVDYGAQGFGRPSSASLSLDPGSQDAAANNAGASWCTAVDFYYNGATPHRGTPNAANPACPAR